MRLLQSESKLVSTPGSHTMPRQFRRSRQNAFLGSHISSARDYRGCLRFRWNSSRCDTDRSNSVFPLSGDVRRQPHHRRTARPNSRITTRVSTSTALSESTVLNQSVLTKTRYMPFKLATQTLVPIQCNARDNSGEQFKVAQPLFAFYPKRSLSLPDIHA